MSQNSEVRNYNHIIYGKRGEFSHVIIPLILGTLLGLLLGIISGLIPGVHANTMAGLLLAVQGVLAAILGYEALAAAMVAALVTHTFLDIIPGTFLGVPDADTALSVLPAHAMCLQGRGEEAVRISALGSACSVAAAMPIFLAFSLFLPALQSYIDWGIGILLILVAGLLIIYSDSPEWSFAVFMTSGLLGLFTFRYSYCAWQTLDSSLLMPLLSGLFGISVLLRSSHGNMPEQHFTGIALGNRLLAKHALLGTLAGAVVGWLPGLSNATANALLSNGVRDEGHGMGFIVATSAANTSNAFLSLAALYSVSRTRNGVMVALASAPLPPVTGLLLAGAVAALLAYLLTVWISHHAYFFSGLPLRGLGYGVMLFVVILSFLLSGPFGLVILVLATAVGLVPPMVNVRRVTCMGAIMLPVIIFSIFPGVL